jgi:hypothetical protein
MKVNKQESYFHTVYELSDGSKILVSNDNKMYVSNKGFALSKNKNTKIVYYMDQELNRFLNQQ